MLPLSVQPAQRRSIILTFGDNSVQPSAEHRSRHAVRGVGLEAAACNLSSRCAAPRVEQRADAHTSTATVFTWRRSSAVCCTGAGSLAARRTAAMAPHPRSLVRVPSVRLATRSAFVVLALVLAAPVVAASWGGWTQSSGNAQKTGMFAGPLSAAAGIQWAFDSHNAVRFGSLVSPDGSTAVFTDSGPRVWAVALPSSSQSLWTAIWHGVRSPDTRWEYTLQAQVSTVPAVRACCRCVRL